MAAIRRIELRDYRKTQELMRIARVFTSCFGLGMLPVAPGTWGSLPAAVIFVVLLWLGVPAVVICLVMAGLVILGSVSCVVFAPAAIEATGKKDPGEVVADELAGQAVAFLAAGFFAAESNGAILALVGFLAFRFFDILKPPPCRQFEKLPAGFGILADDLMAGVYAAIVLHIYIYYFGG